MFLLVQTVFSYEAGGVKVVNVFFSATTKFCEGSSFSAVAEGGVSVNNR